MFEHGNTIPMGLAHTAIGRRVIVPNGREPEVHVISEGDAIGDDAIVSLDEVEVRLDSTDIVELWDKRTKVEHAKDRGFNRDGRYPRISVSAGELVGYVGHYAFLDTGARTSGHRVISVRDGGDCVVVTLGVTEAIGKLDHRLQFAADTLQA